MLIRYIITGAYTGGRSVQLQLHARVIDDIHVAHVQSIYL